MLADRVVAATGGRTLVAARPGIGWLALEVTPAFIWTQITGAVSLEFFYFIAYLRLLGLSDAAMGYLPIMVCAAGVAQVVVVLWHPPGDQRRRCVIDSFWGRSIWIGTILWPLLGRWLGWSMPVIMTGVYACVFTTHVLCGVSNANFFSWTQQLVPQPLRGTFFAWRNLSSYLVVALLLAGIARLIGTHAGNTPAGTSHQLDLLMVLLGGATLVGVAGVWPLSRAPALAKHERTTSYGPLLSRMSGNGPLLRLLAWACLVNAAACLSVVYRALLFLRNGASPSAMATWQAWGQYPCMLLAIFGVGWALPRVHARPLLLLAHVVMIAAELTLLLLTPERLPWLMPLILCVLGIGTGLWSIVPMARQQELLPQGDPRFYAVFFGIISLTALLATLGLPQLVSFLERWSALHHCWNAPWLVVAIGVCLRILATPLLLWPDPPSPGATVLSKAA